MQLSDESMSHTHWKRNWTDYSLGKPGEFRFQDYLVPVKIAFYGLFYLSV